MAINTQSFTSIVSSAVAAIQGAASQLVDLTVGSILRAYAEANAAIAMWLQGIVLQVAALTRFATSNGPDADSFGADFDFPRLPSQPATGVETFARFTPTQQATITAAVSSGTDQYGRTLWTGGTVVQTQDGTEQFQVIPDTTQAAYNATLNAYVIAASVSSCNATVQALTAGSAGNVVAGLVNTLGTSIPGVDTVTNASPFVDGADAESDTAYKARFPEYLASLEKGTPTAVEAAISDVQQGLTFKITENLTYTGAAQDGFFYAVVDDGSGSPPSSLISSIYNAVDRVRPIGSVFAIFAPVVITANVALNLTTATGFVHSSLVLLVQAALEDYINTLPVGATLPYSKLAQIAYDTSPLGITNVSAVTLNGGIADLPATTQQVIKAGTLTVI